MAVIAIDFDHTLVIGDKPIPGARDALSRFHEQGHYIVIHSCNNAPWIEKVLRNNDMWFDHIATSDDCLNGKINADIFVDDKGYRFDHWDGDEVEKIENALGYGYYDNRRLNPCPKHGPYPEAAQCPECKKA